MSIDWEIRYDCVAKETMFLATGWGIRDVRGPYLNKPEGKIVIPDWVLAYTVPTDLTLTFGLSNRSEYEFVEVSVAGSAGVFTEQLEQNGSCEIVIPSILRRALTFELIVTATVYLANRDVVLPHPVIDLLSIDRLRLERNVRPFRPY